MQQPQMVPPQAQAMKPVTSTIPSKIFDFMALVDRTDDPKQLARLAQDKNFGYIANIRLDRLEAERKRMLAAQQAQMNQGQPPTVRDQNLNSLLAMDERLALPNLVNQMEQNPKMMVASGGMVEGYKDGRLVGSEKDYRNYLEEVKDKNLTPQPFYNQDEGKVMYPEGFTDIDPEYDDSFRADKVLAEEKRDKFLKENPDIAAAIQEEKDLAKREFGLEQFPQFKKYVTPPAADPTPMSGIQSIIDQAGNIKLPRVMSDTDIEKMKKDYVPFMDRKKTMREKAGIPATLQGMRDRIESDRKEDLGIAGLQRAGKIAEGAKGIIEGKPKNLIGVATDVINTLTSGKIAEKVGERGANKLANKALDKIANFELSVKENDIDKAITYQDQFEKNIADLRQKNIITGVEEIKLQRGFVQDAVNSLYKQGQLKYLDALAAAQKGGKPMTQSEQVKIKQKNLKDTVSALTKLLSKFDKEELAKRGLIEEDIVADLVTNVGIMQSQVYGGIQTRE